MSEQTECSVPLGLRERLATLAAIIVPPLGLFAAAVFLWGWGFNWVDFGLLLGMYFLTTIGITVGFHRLFVHRSFDTYSGIKAVLAVLGSMAVQGDLFKWVGIHRRHHQYSDTSNDPHTPHYHGAGLWNWIAGYWHSHIGWFFDPAPADLDRYLKDLNRSETLKHISGLFPLWVLLSLLIPAALGGLISGNWLGFSTGLIWGGFARIFLVHHITWSVNSACHLWGLRPFASRDMSRDNIFFGVLALGEGWHNSHHAFPTSARHGLSWWKLDVSYLVIRSLELVGLAWDVKLPTKQARYAKRRFGVESVL